MHWHKSLIILILCGSVSAVASLAQTAESGFQLKSKKTYFGAQTNGLIAVVSIEYDTNQPPHVQVGIYARQHFDTNPPPPRPVKNSLPKKGVWSWTESGQRPIYFLATNAFQGGVIELRDKDGILVPSSKPKEEFGAFYTHSSLGWDGAFKARLADPVIGPQPKLGSFDVNDFFKITKDGDYDLTVWAKIYKLIDQTNGLYQRIDLPAVTIPIKCEPAH